MAMKMQAMPTAPTAPTAAPSTALVQTPLVQMQMSLVQVRVLVQVPLVQTQISVSQLMLWH